MHAMFCVLHVAFLQRLSTVSYQYLYSELLAIVIQTFQCIWLVSQNNRAGPLGGDDHDQTGCRSAFEVCT